MTRYSHVKGSSCFLSNCSCPRSKWEKPGPSESPTPRTGPSMSQCVSSRREVPSSPSLSATAGMSSSQPAQMRASCSCVSTSASVTASAHDRSADAARLKELATLRARLALAGYQLLEVVSPATGGVSFIAVRWNLTRPLSDVSEVERFAEQVAPAGCCWPQPDMTSLDPNQVEGCHV